MVDLEIDDDVHVVDEPGFAVVNAGGGSGDEVSNDANLLQPTLK